MPKVIKPDFIFACRDSEHSDRPYETIHPTAKRLRLDVDEHYADKEAKKIAKELLTKKKYSGKAVLICWHHGEIPALIKALGYASPYKKWPPTVFDRVINIKCGPKTLANQSQELLFGDAK